MNPRTPIAFLVLAALAPAAPAPAPGSLGEGLSYCRVHELPRDMPAPARPGPCVLDLRFAAADAAGAAALNAWVARNASPHSPVFILENAKTSAPLVAAFPGRGPAGQVVLAPASARLSPDIAVDVAPEADEGAYQALEKGAALESLLADFPDKPRVDEAYLEKEHLSDADAPEVASDKDLPPRPRVDLLLQRAVQIHRGLLALKRL